MIKKMLETGPTTWWHNMIYDLIGLEVSLGLDFDKIAKRARDTGIDSRLLDPRGRDKGGIGHKLEELAPHYLGVGSKKSTKTLLHEALRSHDSKIKIADVFRDTPIDLREYEIYAGSDVLLTSRLAEKLHPMVEASPPLRRLHYVEHPLAIRIALMKRIGMRFDQTWSEEAEAHFDKLRDEAEKRLVEEWGVAQTTKWAHTNAADLKRVFGKLGAKFEKRTKPSKTYPDGQISLDKEVLKEFSRLTGDIGKLANDILDAKRNEHYGSYVRGMRDSLGVDGRTHPSTNPLGAATARMSVNDPPLQQLPRDDVWVRGCLLADEDEIVITADFAQIEFRVGAAASRDPTMISRIINREDLHAVTATALFGPDFNKGQRQASKPIGFGRLYMGGPPGVRQAMIQGDTTGYVPPLTDIRRAIKAFDSDYRAYVRWAKRLIAKVEADHGNLTTITGRPLKVHKAYAAPNYAIQSAARDVFAAGITKLHKAGLGDRLRLVVHDEMVLSCRPEDAPEVQREVEKAMNTVLLGVPITTEGEVKGTRWRK
jgi:DNA polymerase-1